MNQLLKNKGSILLEGAFSSVIFLIAFLLMLELFRAAYFHIGLEQAAFIWTRDRALGESVAKSKRDAFNFLGAMFGDARRLDFEANLKFEDFYEGNAIVGKVHYRYEQLFRFGMRKNGEETGKEKHHMEITKKCRFPGYPG